MDLSDPAGCAHKPDETKKGRAIRLYRHPPAGKTRRDVPHPCLLRKPTFKVCPNTIFAACLSIQL